MQFDVALSRFTRVMHRMQLVPMRSMRMMSSQFVFASTMVPGRFAMMLRGVFMMFSGFRVMFFKFLWHRISFLSFEFQARLRAFICPRETHSLTPE